MTVKELLNVLKNTKMLVGGRMLLLKELILMVDNGEEIERVELHVNDFKKEENLKYLNMKVLYNTYIYDKTSGNWPGLVFEVYVKED